MDKAFEQKIKANKKAWTFFHALPPSAKKAISSLGDECQKGRYQA